MKRKIAILLILLLSMIILGACSKKNTVSESEVKTEDNAQVKIQFEDDLGQLVQMDKQAKKIISLYSAHTENLFALGLDEEIIGVGKSDAYPAKVTEKEVYDYRSDPEKVIVADPDLVLIRPFIKKSNPEFVETLENAGIKVVSLYPNKFKEFPDYIKKLAMLTGKEEKAEEMLSKFEKDLKELEAITKNIEPKVNVFFEATETEYRTVTNDSMAARAMKLAGGNNIAADAKPMHGGTSIASYGEERILENAEKIDVYVSQRGAMNAGGNLHAISIRPGFETIKAVKEKRVYEINEKLVSSPTFRFSKGVKELSRMFYPEKMDSLDEFKKDKTLTREQLAKMTVMFNHKGIFVPTSKYYGKKHNDHVYGTFEDVTMDHPNFDYIETAALSSYIKTEKDKFHPEDQVTRGDFAKTLYMLTDLKDQAGTPNIEDMEKIDDVRMVEVVVENGLMALEEGKFYPERVVTENEALESMERIKKSKQ
ncbi:ABC transporter substrate-binding protein [Marinisporobacter balticus]|uniref:Iron complex transport system substrate-binding protein n=1 Tax=Marinisporobacter balticus TaxID=2018667 RepID=A0A4R2KIQ5_9FIRM|nr:ABC transporter substrate-binding protein [Marinisporobacter balticus]TCO72277.1 iron complex transport system substrate-binding protein [Marinisporobacter balticus]